MNDPSSYSAIVNIARTVLPKTQMGQAAWQSDGEELTLYLPIAVIALRERPKEPSPEYEIRVSLPEGGQIGQATFDSQDQQYTLVQELYKAATTASWNLLTKEIQRLAFEQQTIGVATTTATPPPPLPSGPTAEQAQEFFEYIQGEWHLDFTYGQEDCRIDHNGNYFHLTTSHGKTITTTAKPTFRLELLAGNVGMGRVEIAKVEPNGRTRQIEILTFSQKEMAGYAKHDGHKLTYTRR